jgi:hypothetical protein
MLAPVLSEPWGDLRAQAREGHLTEHLHAAASASPFNLLTAWRGHGTTMHALAASKDAAVAAVRHAVNGNKKKVQHHRQATTPATGEWEEERGGESLLRW